MLREQQVFLYCSYQTLYGSCAPHVTCYQTLYGSCAPHVTFLRQLLSNI